MAASLEMVLELVSTVYLLLSESVEKICCFGAGSYSTVDRRTLLADAANRSSSKSALSSVSSFPDDMEKGPFFPLRAVRRTQATGSATEAGMMEAHNVNNRRKRNRETRVARNSPILSTRTSRIVTHQIFPLRIPTRILRQHVKQ
jgi:hypothetical protein